MYDSIVDASEQFLHADVRLLQAHKTTPTSKIVSAKIMTLNHLNFTLKLQCLPTTKQCVSIGLSA